MYRIAISKKTNHGYVFDHYASKEELRLLRIGSDGTLQIIVHTVPITWDTADPNIYSVEIGESFPGTQEWNPSMVYYENDIVYRPHIEDYGVVKTGSYGELVVTFPDNPEEEDCDINDDDFVRVGNIHENMELIALGRAIPRGEEGYEGTMDYVDDCISREGFHYGIVHYTDFKEVKDGDFHRLRDEYISAAVRIQNYVYAHMSHEHRALDEATPFGSKRVTVDIKFYLWWLKQAQKGIETAMLAIPGKPPEWEVLSAKQVACDREIARVENLVEENRYQ